MVHSTGRALAQRGGGKAQRPLRTKVPGESEPETGKGSVDEIARFREQTQQPVPLQQAQGQDAFTGPGGIGGEAEVSLRNSTAPTSVAQTDEWEIPLGSADTEQPPVEHVRGDV